MNGTDTNRIYGRCKVCGSISRRDVGQRHGDGQIDSDEHPVWLLEQVGHSAEVIDAWLEKISDCGLTLVDCTEHCCGNLS